MELFNPTDHLALFTVLRNNIAIETGPTPPGTGVIHFAFSIAVSNSTSPTHRDLFGF